MARPAMTRRRKALIFADAFAYDPETGAVTWKVKQRYVAANAGDEVGSRSQGYRRVKFCGESILCHRIAWALHYGEEPDGFIDHINGDRSDNRIANLRAVTKGQNAKNKGAYGTKTLPKGVTYHPSSGKFRARIRCNGILHSLGLFADVPDAERAYSEAASSFFGELARSPDAL